MAWMPEHAVINSRAIADNLLAWFELKQVEALAWAGDGSLKPFQTIANSMANPDMPLYPAINFNDDNDEVDYTNEITVGAYRVVFELTVQNSNASAAIVNARKYAIAIASMIRNCPPATLCANTGAVPSLTVLNTMTIGFDFIKAGKDGTARNDFGQIFRVAVTYTLHADGI